MLLHHISLPVSDLKGATRLYDAVMHALGYRCVWATTTAVGYGLEDGKDKLCIKLQPNAIAAGPGFHLAFSAPSQAAVDEFHQMALVHGARDNGAPGLREHYSPNYYTAFIIDLDGHRLEAVHK